MKPGGGKKKGASFEREICKELSLWITGGKKEDCFWRSAMSGGRATLGFRKGKNIRQGGDITAVSEEGHAITDNWYIECKHVKSLDVGQFLIKGAGKLSEFWIKAKQEAKRHERDPMIIAKQNGWPILVITRPNHVAHWTPPIITCIARRRGCDITLFSDLMKAKP